MSDLTKEQRMARGDRAEALLKNPTFCEAVSAVDADLQKAILSTALSESDKREDAFALYSGFREVMKRLNSWVRDAQVVRDQEL